jgi:hypothetical protein
MCSRYNAPVAGCVPPPNRPPQIYKEFTKIPGAPGKVHEVVRRLPTPTADVIDKTIIEQPGQDVINVVYERPLTPPPNVVERRLVEAPPPTQVNCFERRVPHRPRQTYVTSAPAQAIIEAAPPAQRLLSAASLSQVFPQAARLISSCNMTQSSLFLAGRTYLF